MIDIENIIANVKFKCRACGKESGCKRVAGNRNEAQRISSDPRERPEITIYCEYCGTANALGIEDIGRTNLGSIISDLFR